MNRFPHGLAFGTHKTGANYISVAGTNDPTALLHGAGSTSEPVTTGTADKNFLGYFAKTTASSGDCRGMYMRLYLGGTGGYGDAVRAYTTVSGTGYSYASGLHGTMSLAVGGTITGSGAGIRATLEAASATRTLPGNIAALQIDSNIGANNTVPADAALIRVDKAGSVDVTTFLHVADDQCLKGSAATGAASDALKVVLPGGTVRYISLIAAS